MFTKKRLLTLIRSCGGEGHYSGKTKTMYVKHLNDKWTFNVLTAYLFDQIKIGYQ
jgi:hypothetical protein